MIDIAGRLIPGGLLYVIDDDQDQDPQNPATILLGVAVGDARRGREIGYWPFYSLITPDQRAAYLDWLATGRKAPDVDLGFVFLFFYGLEWRALVDGQDHRNILPEILRLYRCYGHHKSFHEYATNLFGALLLHVGKTSSLDKIYHLLTDTARAHGGMSGLLLDGILLHHAGKNLPLVWAYEAALSSAAYSKGVAFERDRAAFDAVFARRFTERYPEGLLIPAVTATVPVDYRWAMAASPCQGLTIPTTGLIIGPTGKKRDLATGPLWNDLYDLWKATTKEVMATTRAERTSTRTIASDVVSVSIEVDRTTPIRSRPSEALPPRPRAVVDPMVGWFSSHSDDQGIARVTLGELYRVRFSQSLDAVTGKQQTELIEALDLSGFALEPDSRPSCRKAPADELRLVYRPEQAKAPSARCQQMRILVEAAVAIASSDGAVDEMEMEEIIEHIDEKDVLSSDERRRLRWYAVWLNASGKLDHGFNRLRRAELPKTHRKAIAALAVAIVVRDGVVTDAERTAVIRLYRALELPDTDLDELLKLPQEASGKLTIDWAAVARLQAETQEVQGMLAQVLEQGAEPEEQDLPADPPPGVSASPATEPPAAADTPAPSTVFPGLDPRAAQILAALTGRTEISAADLNALCQPAGLFPSAAIDLINEWSDQHLGDRCVDGDGPYQIAAQLLPSRT